MGSEKYLDRKEYILLSFFLIFLMLKPGFGVEEWEIASLPLFFTLVQNSSIFLSLIALFLCLLLSFLNSFKFRISFPALLMGLILIWYNIRSYQFGSGDINSIISIFILISILIYFSKFSLPNKQKLLNSSIKTTFIVWILLNLLLYFGGYGYAPNNSSMRFFGSTPHPNSCGAFALISMSYFLVNSSDIKNKKNKYFDNIFLFLSAFLVFLAGSRSAIIAMILIVFLYSSNKLRALFLSLIFALLNLYMFNMLPNWSIFSVLNRIKDAPIDNRNEVWGLLVQDFYLNPILGSGDYSGVSGSGYLTAFGGTGIIFGFIFIVVYMFGIYKSFFKLMKFREDGFKNYIYILFLVISFLSIFEGFVFDKFGFIQVLLFICLIVFGPYIKKNI